MREGVVGNLKAFPVHFGIVHVCSMPVSGKSVLLNLLHNRIVTEKPNWRVMSLMTWPEGLSKKQSKVYMEEHLCRV